MRAGDQFIDELKTSARGGYELSKVHELIMLAKGGKQNKRDSGLSGLTDSEVSERAHDPKLGSKERRRYQTEEKARGIRNVKKRNQ